jgi:hypothetical protein
VTPDEMEARNRKYGNDTQHVLLLSSGRVAVFDRDYELRDIVNTSKELVALILEEPFPSERPPQKRARERL